MSGVASLDENGAADCAGLCLCLLLTASGLILLDTRSFVCLFRESSCFKKR
jgi:hypothetical protein